MTRYTGMDRALADIIGTLLLIAVIAFVLLVFWPDEQWGW